jgi:uncharacterized membrane protein
MAVAHSRVQHESGGSVRLALVAAALILLFVSAPWGLEEKAHAVLHGLCAQTPSHSFVLGDRRLPFDARMTGIYGGFLGALIPLVIWRRHRAGGAPPWGVTGLVGAGVTAMAIDGVNSLLRDIGHWHPYAPRNELRLLTGAATGIAIAVIICFLCAITLWRRPDLTTPVLRGKSDLWLLWIAQIPFALLVLTGGSVAYPPAVALLVISALLVVSSLALVTIVILRGLDYTFVNDSDLASVAAVALLAGATAISGLAAVRYVLEWRLGLVTLT